MASVRPPYKASRVLRGPCNTTGCLQIGMTCQTFLIKLALPLYFYLIRRARDLLYSHHRAHISLRYGIPSNSSDVTVGLACMTVVVTPEKFVHGPCLLAETVHIKVGSSGSLYYRPFRPCSILQPRLSFPCRPTTSTISYCNWHCRCIRPLE